MIRIDNFRLLMKQTGKSKADIARHMKVSDTYVSKLLTGKPGTFGEKAARRIEEVFKKPRFWLDVIHPDGEYGETSVEQEGAGVVLYGTFPSSGVTTGDNRFSGLHAEEARDTRFPMAPVLQWGNLGAELLRANREWPEEELKAVPTAKAVSDKVKWVPVPDDSLAPKVLQGDLIAIDPEGQPQRGEVALFQTTDGEFLLRRFQPLVGEGFEAIDGQGRALDSARHGLRCVGSFVGLFRDSI